MKLAELMNECEILRMSAPSLTDITAVVCDSRAAEPHSAFVAVKGCNNDGHRYVDAALSAGAVCIIEDESFFRHNCVLVSDTHAEFARMCKAMNDAACDRLTMIGITGTAGKTTTASLLQHILCKTGVPCGMIGTLGCFSHDDTRLSPPALTTPMPDSLHASLAVMEKSGARACVLEASSHALKQKRLEGIAFDIAVFTNIGRDHLDYHNSYADYLESKLLLFRASKKAAVNTDDPTAESVLAVCRGDTVSYGIKNADIYADEVDYEQGSFNAVFPDGRFPVPIRCGGRTDVINSLAALAASYLYGIKPADACTALWTAAAPQGRFELVMNEPYRVIIDFAHTPESLSEAISSLKPLCKGRIIVVFGCGGDRDGGKRVLMGRAASLADISVITSDNPRSEDPLAIIRAASQGCENKHIELPARRAATELAMRLARRGDIVLLAGKGHERYQELGSEIAPYDEREVVATIAKKLYSR